MGLKRVGGEGKNEAEGRRGRVGEVEGSGRKDEDDGSRELYSLFEKITNALREGCKEKLLPSSGNE